MILITGATGQNGGELIKQLAPRGEVLRALVRHPEKAGALQASGVEIATGDLTKPETLGAALDGVDKVFYLAGNEPETVEAQKSFIELAKQSGVKQVVNFSILGVA